MGGLSLGLSIKLFQLSSTSEECPHIPHPRQWDPASGTRGEIPWAVQMLSEPYPAELGPEILSLLSALCTGTCSLHRVPWARRGACVPDG